MADKIYPPLQQLEQDPIARYSAGLPAHEEVSYVNEEYDKVKASGIDFDRETAMGENWEGFGTYVAQGREMIETARDEYGANPNAEPTPNSAYALAGVLTSSIMKGIERTGKAIDDFLVPNAEAQVLPSIMTPEGGMPVGGATPFQNLEEHDYAPPLTHEPPSLEQEQLPIEEQEYNPPTTGQHEELPQETMPIEEQKPEDLIAKSNDKSAELPEAPQGLEVDAEIMANESYTDADNILEPVDADITVIRNIENVGAGEGAASKYIDRLKENSEVIVLDADTDHGKKMAEKNGFINMVEAKDSSYQHGTYEWHSDSFKKKLKDGNKELLKSLEAQKDFPTYKDKSMKKTIDAKIKQVKDLLSKVDLNDFNPFHVSEAHADQVTIDYRKDIAAAEHNDDVSGDYAQLENIVLKDLKQKGRLDRGVTLEQVKSDELAYDNVVKLYWDRLDDFGIPDKDKVVWWLMPGRYRRAKGKIKNLDKKWHNIMNNRVKNIKASRGKRDAK